MGKRRPLEETFNQNFDDTIAHKQQHDLIQELKQKLKTQKEENQKQKSLLSQLRSALESQSGVLKVSLNNMLPSEQCRTVFTQAAIIKRANSLKAEGQLEKLILIPIANKPGFYYIEDGELTWRSAKYLVEQQENQWQTLESVLSPPEENQKNIHRKTLLHHLHSEGLTPLDRSQSILKEILWAIDIDLITNKKLINHRDKMIAASKLIRSLDHSFRKKFPRSWQELILCDRELQQVKLEELDLSDYQKTILLVLLDFQIDLHSFAANDLGMAILPEIFIEAIRNRELPCRQALEISKITAKKLNKPQEEVDSIWTNLIDRVCNEKMSVRNIREEVANILSSTETPLSLEKKELRKNYQDIKAKIKSFPVTLLSKTQLNSLKSSLETKIQQIESVLEQQN